MRREEALLRGQAEGAGRRLGTAERPAGRAAKGWRGLGSPSEGCLLSSQLLHEDLSPVGVTRGRHQRGSSLEMAKD